MPPNEGPSDVTGCKFSSQGSDRSARNGANNKVQNLAKKLDQHRGIYVLKGALDGANVSYTTFKYFFDALNPDLYTSSSTVMHDWMLTPEGIAVAALESVFLIVFSMLANHLKVQDDYELSLMLPGISIKKNKLYVQITENGAIRYTVKTPSGIDLSAVISAQELGLDPDLTQHFTLKQLQPYLSKILEITLQRGHTQKPKPRLFNQYVIQIWPYFRDALKGLKNSYKGINSLFMAFDLLGMLGAQELTLMLMPMAVALGALTILNRIWYRRMKNQRIEKQERNKQLYQAILAKKSMTEQEARDFDRQKQQAQNQKERRKCFASAVFSGLTDGLYWYMGVFTLASISGPLFMVICVISATCVLFSVATRLYDEYDYQNKLKMTQLEVELALAMQLLKTELQQLDELLIKPDFSLDQETILRANIAKNWANFTQSHSQLKSLSTILNTSAFLSGLKNGLTAYGVFASVLFAVGAMLLLASVPFPPIFLMTVVFIGVACLVGFTIHSLVASYRYRHSSEQMQLHQHADALLADAKTKVEYLKITPNEKQARINQSDCVRTVLATVEDQDKQLVVKPSPQYSLATCLQKCLEIARAFFTGVKQAFKTEDFTLGSFSCETVVTYIVTGVLGLISSISGALHALAKGFGQSDHDVSESSALVLSTSQLLSSKKASLTPSPINTSTHSPSSSSSLPSIGHSAFSLFHPKKVIPRSRSEPILSGSLSHERRSLFSV